MQPLYLKIHLFCPLNGRIFLSLEHFIYLKSESMHSLSDQAFYLIFVALSSLTCKIFSLFIIEYHWFSPAPRDALSMPAYTSMIWNGYSLDFLFFIVISCFILISFRIILIFFQGHCLTCFMISRDLL